MPNNYKVIARLRGCIIILVTSSQGNSSSVCLQSRPPIVVKLASSRSQNLIRFLHSSNCTTRQVAPSQTYGRCQRLSHVSLQLYRIFPHLGCNYYLSKLLFSPDSSEARILIGKEVHTAEEYRRYLANPSISGPWPNPLLKFDVFDGNPYKPALNSISQPSWGIPWRTPPAMSPVGNIALPSPCPINFNPRPLSYPMPPPPILFPSPPMSASSRPMPQWKEKSFNKATTFGQISVLSIAEQRKTLPIYKLRDSLLQAIGEVCNSTPFWKLLTQLLSIKFSSSLAILALAKQPRWCNTWRNPDTQIGAGLDVPNRVVLLLCQSLNVCPRKLDVDSVRKLATPSVSRIVQVPKRRSST